MRFRSGRFGFRRVVSERANPWVEPIVGRIVPQGGPAWARVRCSLSVPEARLSKPTPDSTKWLRAEVARALAPLSADLTAVLHRLIGHTYPPAVAFVEFQVFPEPGSFTERFPVRAFFLDDGNTEHFEYVQGKATHPTCVDPSLLDIRGVVSRETWRTWEGHDPDIDSYTVAAEAVVPWFAACWKAAGGAAFRLPAFVCLHDDPWTFDLRANRWLDAATEKPVAGEWPPRPG